MEREPLAVKMRQKGLMGEGEGGLQLMPMMFRQVGMGLPDMWS